MSEKVIHNKLKLKHNSAYININLVDELDYVIGGYGKPTLEFLYSFNTFVESYVLNENFYLSKIEFQHYKLSSGILFPNGRPIFNLLLKDNKLASISGLGSPMATIAYIGEAPDNKIETIDKAFETFYSAFSEKIKSEYFILSSLDKSNVDIKYLDFDIQFKKLYVVDKFNNSNEIVKSLFKATENTNIQMTLPIYTYKNQLVEIKKYGITNEVFKKLSELHLNKLSEVSKYMGYSNQSLPPLIPILLSQCKTINDIPEKLEQLRKDFTELRKTSIDFEKEINESKTIKEQLKVIDNFNNFWEAFHKKYEIKSKRLLYRFWDVAKESNYEDSLDSAIDTESTSEIIKDLNLGKVIGKVSSKTFDWIKDRRVLNRFRGITNVWELFEKSPNLRTQFKDIERIFNIVVTEQDLIRIKEYVGKK